MTIHTLAQIIHGKMEKVCPDKEINQIQIDTRKLNENDVYIAIVGKNLDGHDFIEDAIQKGASLIVASKPVSIETEIPILYVEDTMKSLEDLAVYYRKTYPAYTIAVTGSVGKTTTRELLYTILSTTYSVLKSEKNHNNHIGIPLTLFQLNEDYNIVLLEMGMNHLGEIEHLSKMVEPDLGVITNIGTSHIGNLGSKKKILQAKMEIVKGMEDGTLFVNGDDPYLRKIKSHNNYRVIHVGNKHSYYLQPFAIQENLDSLSFKIKYQKEIYDVFVPISGKQFLSNILLAMEVALYLHIDIQTIIESLRNFKPFQERMNVIQTDQFTFIDDCYNASYESCTSLFTFLNHQKKEKIIILGDILELGNFSHKIHKKLKKQLQKMKHTTILSVGEATKSYTGKNMLHFDNIESLIAYLIKMNTQNKLIALKGSRGMHLEKVRQYFIKES